MSYIRTLMVLCQLAVFTMPIVQAQPQTETPPFADRATGDWGGLRSELAEQGFDFFAYYNAIFASNVSGGIKNETNYAGGLFFGTKIDLDRFLQWDDMQLTVSGINRHGSDISPSVGSQYSVMQLVGGQTTFLYNVTLEKFFNDGDWSVKFGRMTATDDFVGSPLYSYSLNNAVNGQIRAVLFDGVMTSYPFAVWGGRVKAKLSDDTTFQFGAFQMTPEMWDPNNHGLDMGIGADDGVELMAQLDWTPTLADKPARFFVGVNQAVGLDLDRFNSADTQEHLTRFFGHAQYQIYRPSPDSDQGLTAFATLAYSPDESVAIIPLQTTFGLNYKGLFPNRPADHTVFFLTYGKFSKDYSDQLVAAGNTPANYEMVVELGHRFQVTASSYIQLDAQWINRPGGTGDVSDAIVLGSQFGISF